MEIASVIFYYFLMLIVFVIGNVLGIFYRIDMVKIFFITILPQLQEGFQCIKVKTQFIIAYLKDMLQKTDSPVVETPE